VTTATTPGTMLAAVFEAPGRLAIAERPLPALQGPADVLVDVEACGICGTDVHILADPPGHPGTPGCVLGHELVGVVAEVGPAALDVGVGDRVVVAPNLSCGSCTACKRGMYAHCERFTTVGIFRDGGLAARVSVPAASCHRISRELPRQVAALAEPLSCVVNGMRQARPLPGETAAVLGAGAIGLMYLALLRAAGVSRVVVTEPSPARAAIARQMGAAAVVDPRGPDPLGALLDAAGGPVDVVVDAVGSQLPLALDVAAPGGRVLLFGMNANARADVAQVDITRKELTVFGTYVGNATFPDAVRLLEDGVVDLEPIISHWVPLAELPIALEAIERGEAVKAVIDLVGA
jgi:threonine dehydrogenase-like Zn-dependent dehydrogenase